MNFIQSSPQNNEQIVDLLKLSLGESTSKKSVTFWNWKHNENPFGESTVVLAFEQETLIGVRAFMKWKFVNKDRAIICGRAVDTAVHPQHQGKGIFTKLTLQALNDAKTDGVDLIFNSPNKISKAGYLKMGWVENGQLPIKIAMASFTPKKYHEEGCDDIYAEYSFPDNLSIKNLSIKNSNDLFETAINSDFINWRYKNCPVNKYGCIYNEGEFLIVFRLKKIKNFIELRLCDVVIESDNISIDKAIQSIKVLCKRVKPLFISCANISSTPVAFYKKLCFTPSLKFGPEITLRTVAAHSNVNSFKDFKQWQPSLGCIELF